MIRFACHAFSLPLFYNAKIIKKNDGCKKKMLFLYFFLTYSFFRRDATLSRLNEKLKMKNEKST